MTLKVYVSSAERVTVTRMMSFSYLPNLVQIDSSSPDYPLDICAKSNDDADALSLQIINRSLEPAVARISIEGMDEIPGQISAIELAADPYATNTNEERDLIHPVEKEVEIARESRSLVVDMKPYSFVVVRLGEMARQEP